MKKNTLIIGGAVAVVIIAVAVFMIMRQPEEPVVNNVTNITINPVTTPTNVITQTLTGTMETGAAVVLTSNVATTFGSVTYPTVTTWSVDATLVEGSNIITATATDEAGNTATATVTVVLDIVITVTINPVTTPTNVITQTLTGTMETGAAVVLTSNVATTFGSVTHPTTTTWSVEATLVEGSNIITATATDEAGNIDTAMVTIVLIKVPVDPVVNDVIEPFIPDMTIEAEFCRDVITRAQLREITGYQGEFTFTAEEYDDPVLGLTRSCDIHTGMMEISLGISVIDLNFETMMRKIKLEMPEMYAMMEELDNIGEKAVIMDIMMMHMVFFSDRETGWFVGTYTMGLTREKVIEFTRQVEINIR